MAAKHFQQEIKRSPRFVYGQAGAENDTMEKKKRKKGGGGGKA